MKRPVSSYYEGLAAAEQYDHFSNAGWDAQGLSNLNTLRFVIIMFRQQTWRRNRVATRSLQRRVWPWTSLWRCAFTSYGHTRLDVY